MGFLNGLLKGVAESAKNDDDWCLCPKCKGIMRKKGENYVCEECGNDDDDYNEIWKLNYDEEDPEMRDYEDDWLNNH